MKTKSRVLLMVTVLILSAFVFFSVSAEDVQATESGKCGDDMEWTG